MRFSSVLRFIAPLCVCATLSAQTPSGFIVSTDYRPPHRLLHVAPGQVINVTVAGISASSAAIRGPQGYPLAFGDIRVPIRAAGMDPLNAELVSITQQPCTQFFFGCEPTSSMTLLIPFGLQGLLDRADREATLSVERAGAPVASIPLRVTGDQLHILNSCDETTISVSIFNTPQKLPCTHAVTHLNASLVSAGQPATIGETLVMWVWGGGAPAGEVSANETRPLRFMPTVSFGSEPGRPVASALTFGTTGLTQILFTVPPPTAGTVLPECGSASNVMVTVAGPNSFDRAALCVRP